MVGERINFDLTTDQRHFHSIALRDAAGFTLPDYWRQVGKIGKVKQQHADFTYPFFEIQHRKLRSDYAYPRGKLLETVSSRGDGSPPYLYDIFALQMRLETRTFFVFAFPFVALARDVTEGLISSSGVLKKADILRVNVPQLIEKNDLTHTKNQLHVQVVELSVIIADDPSLSSLAIRGDNPLRSVVYKDFLEHPIRSNNFIPDHCALACELPWPPTEAGQSILSGHNVRARMHMDAFGNFKFYLHVAGENLVVIPYLLDRLTNLKCLDTVTVNPLLRAQQEEEQI